MRRVRTNLGYRYCDPDHRRARPHPGGDSRGGTVCVASLSWRARPKLAIRDDGLVIRGWSRTNLLRHSDIKIIRITEFRRLTRKVRLLEIDTTDDRLMVFTRWDLGTDPLNVLDALTAAGYAGSR